MGDLTTTADDSPEGDLTPKQQCFVAEYLVDLNATQAAIRAGYSERTATEIGYENLRKPKVAAAIAVAMKERQKRVEVSQDFVLSELLKIAGANLLDYMCIGDDGKPRPDFSRMTREQAGALSEIVIDEYMDGRGEDARSVKRTRFKLHDKHSALVTLMRHKGWLTDKVEHRGAVTLESLLEKIGH
jgi:phage terminase small subunit